MSPAPQRILIAVIGSLGDLHPALTLARELQSRGYHPTIAATNHYRSKVEALNLAFTPMRPHWDPTDRKLIAQCEDIKRGIEILFRRIILPHLPDSFDDLLAAVRATSADLLIAGEMVYAAPLVAEKLTLPWVSLILSPASFLSAHDPSITANVPGLIHLRKLGWPAYRTALNAGRFLTRHWWEPVRQLRRAQNLTPRTDPLFKDKFSPLLNLALFSKQLAKPQPDWPPSTLQPGFLFDDSTPASMPELDAFLAQGEAPIVFTQGSTAVHNPGSFYQQSAAAASQLHRRALLLGTISATNANALALPYASYAAVFPHASLIVHQGGSGTTGEAMRAGKPMLIVPYGWDQPDNAARIERLGIGLSIARTRYTANTAAAALHRLLNDPAFTTRARIIADAMHTETPLTTACNAIENLFQQPRSNVLDH